MDAEDDASLVELGINALATLEGDPVSQALRRSLEEQGRTSRLAELLAYQSVAGTTAHRVAGAAWTSRFGLQVKPEQVVVCAGGQHSMDVALAALTWPGDTLVTEALTYPGMKVLARRFQLRLQGVAMDAQGLVPEAFEAACRGGTVRLLYTQPTCHNPTGALLPEQRPPPPCEDQEVGVQHQMPQGAFVVRRETLLVSTTWPLALGSRRFFEGCAPRAGLEVTK